MPARPPTFAIALTVHQRFPGIWSDLVQRVINGAQDPSSASLHISSWWRDPGSNASVGGHPQSQHLVGLAMDVGGPIAARELYAQHARNFLHVVEESDHVHVQYWAAGLLASTGLLDTIYA